MFTVYILASHSTRKWYYGSTERSVFERLREHNWDNSHFTGGKGPWTLIFVREFAEKKQALQFEKKLKKLRNKDYVKRAYAAYFVER